MSQEPKKRSLMRNIGLFFGNLARGASGAAEGERSRVVSRDVHEETRRTDTGSVTLRRTVVEEVIVRPDPPSVAPPLAPPHPDRKPG
ncbi:MAG: hypothetical protein JNM07_11010 [Phycisphaerae bacterium]|nr:hypothetical protein [Phycisphaerae bacterium]